MYDILQLNDMLVPELLDIAEQQSISNANKLEKQELIYKILDKQTIMNNTEKKEGEIEKPKRKRIIKPLSEAGLKEAPALPVADEQPKEIKHKKADEKKKPAKEIKGRRRARNIPREEIKRGDQIIRSQINCAGTRRIIK